MSDKTYIGVRASRLESGETLKPYTGVIVNFEDASGEIQSYTAGTVSGENVGSVLEVEFPWATQAIADSLLARVQGYAYTPFTAKDARLDPAAELGDGVTVGGIYSVLASRTSVAAAIEADEIGADYDEEINHEFRYESQIERSIRTLNKASASLRVSVDEIIGEVTDGAGNWTMLTMNPQGVIITGSSGGAVEINGGQLKANSISGDRITAGTEITSPIISGAQYFSYRGKTKLTLAETLQAGQEYPSMIFTSYFDHENPHEVFRIDDINNGVNTATTILRVYGDDAIGYYHWGTNYGEIDVYQDTYMNAHLVFSSVDYGMGEPTGGGEDGQIYMELQPADTPGWHEAKLWVYRSY